MTVALVDTNVLIALIDETHIHHEQAFDWFEHDGRRAWATCPIVENGAIRIISQPSYTNPTPAATVAFAIRELKALEGHEFWPDSISMTDRKIFESLRFGSHARLTDTYLLGLAKANDGCLVTFDRRLGTDAVIDGRPYLRVLD